MDAKKTGELIATLRKEKGMNQKDLADKLGVTNKAISRWETGRGYPDIEILPVLAETFEISVQELLNGERMLETHKTSVVEPVVVSVCEYAGEQKKKMNRTILLLIAVVGFLLISMVVMFVKVVLPEFIEYVYGSDKCVIAENYESLTYYGQRYVPFPMGEYTCVTGERIIAEAQVENAPFIGKLFFGDMLYEIKGVTDHSLVYLQTDYDSLISPYFVLESEYDKYEHLMNSGSYRFGYGLALQPDGYVKELEHPALVEAIHSSEDNETAMKIDLNRSLATMEVRIYEQNHIFLLWAGEFRQYEDGYYWGPNSSGGEYFVVETYYKVPDVYSNLLDELFALVS